MDRPAPSASGPGHIDPPHCGSAAASLTACARQRPASAVYGWPDRAWGASPGRIPAGRPTQRGSPESAGPVARRSLAQAASGDARAVARSDCLNRLAKEPGNRGLHSLAILFALDGPAGIRPGAAPQARSADPYTALAGLCLAHAVKDAAAEAQWADRIAQVQKQMGPGGPSAFAPYRLLVGLARGEARPGEGPPWARSRTFWAFGRTPAAELVSTAASNPNAREEAFVLLRSFVAMGIGQPLLRGPGPWTCSRPDPRASGPPRSPGRANPMFVPPGHPEPPPAERLAARAPDPRRTGGGRRQFRQKRGAVRADGPGRRQRQLPVRAGQLRREGRQAGRALGLFRSCGTTPTT